MTMKCIGTEFGQLTTDYLGLCLENRAMATSKQLHIGVFFQGVGHTIAWRHPNHPKHDSFETYVRFAQNAERGLLDLIFFGEGLVVREHRDRFFGPIVNGRPDTLALLPALAAVT